MKTLQNKINTAYQNYEGLLSFYNDISRAIQELREEIEALDSTSYEDHCGTHFEQFKIDVLALIGEKK